MPKLQFIKYQNTKHGLVEWHKKWEKRFWWIGGFYQWSRDFGWRQRQILISIQFSGNMRTTTKKLHAKNNSWFAWNYVCATFIFWCFKYFYRTKTSTWYFELCCVCPVAWAFGLGFDEALSKTGWQQQAGSSQLCQNVDLPKMQHTLHTILTKQRGDQVDGR